MFASLIKTYFPNLLKEEYLLDLYDMMCGNLATTELTFDSVLSYLYSQIDQYREISSSLKAKTRDNNTLRA